MNANLENETPGLNNPETYVLIHNRFNTYLVLIFTDLKKAQIYKMPHRNSHHQEIEIVIKFDYQHLFKPFGLDEKTHARRETNENFLFKTGDKNYIYVGEKIFPFKTIDDFEEYFSQSGFNDVKYVSALSYENIYYMLYQKIITIEEHENSKIAEQYQYLYKKKEVKGDKITVENEGVVEYGNDFINYNIIQSKQ